MDMPQHLRNPMVVEDAMKKAEPFLFHSVLSPLINLGLLTTTDVLDRVLEAYEKDQAPLNSVEGFIRQILGCKNYLACENVFGKLFPQFSYQLSKSYLYFE